MATARVQGLTVGYEVIGEAGRPWVLTPGGRDSKDTPGLRETARALAERGNRVLIWDRPNTGESDVCFTGESESAMQADTLAALLRHLGLGPAVIAAGSGGSRVSLLAAARHPDVASALAVWWISGGVYGLLSVGMHYCGESVRAAWEGGMEAVADLPSWSEVLARNPGNRARFLAQDPAAFIATMERWLAVYCPSAAEPVPGLTAGRARELDLPALVFRSGTADIHHRRETSEELARLLPGARLVEPPWGDAEWPERQAARASGEAPGLFVRWPLLAPLLHDWAESVLPAFKEA
ncbi:pimeloyl-ACP methyl ester carboxylesterase [Actinocorallia herbida]|uniref:Pimeloyl-ACP methyl ester carboxylesterase n=1 Tax=Actinocorallia herbida TaxID=58109 RepID=A0A3N1CXC6_9ACTN|nr:alpha/beta hydrolase [Actinocorallia herbida]ROO85924.1 pimeloyl-ACP methyl ester carboxylesterase [Actinocorallia herbida]